MKIKLLAIFACLLWGSAFAGAKIGFTYTTPLHLSGMRFTLAGLLLVPFLLWQGVDWKANLKEWRYMALFGLLQTFIQYGLFFMGLNCTGDSSRHYHRRRASFCRYYGASYDIRRQADGT